ncbi:MAG: hypothetical protein GWO11_01015 [Desulfuromonadales bacterium]|nr:hypothetical protein [Desulfuromonadales bacterium]NIR33090.1 hypothetical protein [Desulfuromonadales bacterium]NIS41869.1 hypothetical protein [Desulfuromonadales bacterium]
MAESSCWEALCRRCGRCCYEKYEVDGRIYYSDEPCEFLDTDSLLCTVYDQRHRRREDCAPLTPRVVSMGALPADCPYVAGIDGYVAPLPLEALPEVEE